MAMSTFALPDVDAAMTVSSVTVVVVSR